jgi:prepilin-type N-terminal cleavage/methylation domain-containing protein
MSPSSYNRGFTVVELSVVMVIIGFILGGVLVGRDLLRAANVRAQVAQIESINTAVNVFETRYNCLPGDCDHAVRVGLGTDGGVGDDGNGNNILNSSIHDLGTPGAEYNLSTAELANFWYHLMRAKLISGTYPGYTAGMTLWPGVDTPALKLEGTGLRYPSGASPATPSSSLKGGFCVIFPPEMQNVEGADLYEINPVHALVMANRCDLWESSIYKAGTALALDSKMDDGLPRNGTVRAFMTGLYLWSYDLSYFGKYSCILDDQYNVLSDEYPLDPTVVYNGLPYDVLTMGKLCGMIVQTGF